MTDACVKWSRDKDDTYLLVRQFGDAQEVGQPPRILRYELLTDALTPQFMPSTYERRSTAETFLSSARTDTLLAMDRRLPVVHGRQMAATRAGQIQTCQSWLDECCETHPACGPGTPQRLPHRILELRKAGSPSAVPTARLLVGSTHNARYVCLSHRWGIPGPLVC